MAPIRTKRSNIRVRAAGKTNTDPRGKYAPAASAATSVTESRHPSSSKQGTSPSTKRKRDDQEDDFNWRLNKRDKRTIKHNVFLAKVQDSGIQKKPLKRRRPSKKLKADIGGLADALPELDDEDAGSNNEWEGVSDGEDHQMHLDAPKSRRKRPAQNKMVMKSLRHRPGAMKRKRKMEDAEIERFRRNLAQMAAAAPKPAAVPSSGTAVENSSTQGAHADRWAALRNFIGSTMETDKSFASR